MIPVIAKVVYEARRALHPLSSEPTTNTDPTTVVVKPPFEELTSAEREPLFAEVIAALHSGAAMADALGQAIFDALR